MSKSQVTSHKSQGKSKVWYILFFLFIISSLVNALEVPQFLGEEFIVTATRIPLRVSETPWEIQVIRPTDNDTTLANILRSLPGVDIKANGGLGAVTSINLRGSSTQQVLILVDGKRINSPTLGLYDLADISLNNVEKIEVVKGPLSSIYGPDALGGVINVITKKPGSVVKLSYGTYATQSYSIQAGDTVIGYLNTLGHRQNSSLSALDLSQKFSWDSPLGFWQLGLAGYFADKGVPNVPNTIDDLYSAYWPFARQVDQNLFLDLIGKGQYGDMGTEVKFYQTQLNQKSHNFKGFDYFTFISPQDPANYVDSETLTCQTGLEFSQSIKDTINYGLSVREDAGRSTYAGDHTVSNVAIYGQEKVSNDNTTVVVGMRLDKHSLFGYAINPSVGGNLKLAEDCTLRASWGTGFRAPTLNDLYWNDPSTQMFGDTSLKPETNQSWDMGVSKKIGAGEISLDYYSASLKNLIAWDYNATTYITKTKNFGEVEVRGLEGIFYYPITPLLSAFINYTWQNKETTKDLMPINVGKKNPYAPENKYNLGLSVQEKVKLFVRYEGERYADAANTIKLPEYSVVNLSASQKIGSCQLALAIDNLFNADYYESVGYYGDPASFGLVWETRSYPMPGRTITVSIGGEL